MNRLGVSLFVVSLLGCDGNPEEMQGPGESVGETEHAAPETEPPSVRTTPAAASGGHEDPCELLTETAVRTHFSVAAATAIQARRSPTNHCSYRWENPNADEIRQQMQERQREHMAKMMKNIRRRPRGQGLLDTIIDMPSFENEVSLSVPRATFDSPASAMAAFEATTSRLQTGTSQRVKTRGMGETVTFRLDMEAVDGIGDAAKWSPRMGQLSVVAGTRVFHLRVKVEEEDEDNLPLARALAERVLGD